MFDIDTCKSVIYLGAFNSKALQLFTLPVTYAKNVKNMNYSYIMKTYTFIT